MFAVPIPRAFGFSVENCPCGGRRKLIAVIRNPAQGEKILRHVGEWREAGDRDDDGAIAIRGPPGTFDDDVDAPPSDTFDCGDDPGELDWAAQRRAGRRARSQLALGGGCARGWRREGVRWRRVGGVCLRRADSRIDADVQPAQHGNRVVA
ncbi:MAG: hypothetical protein FJ100_21405 [Deltaproteobacteria bacterium]|nr:hypothetical protein [Deltaproteobacteria bacterium]